MTSTTTDLNTSAAAGNGELPAISGADSKLLHAIFQNLAGKVEFDVGAVANLLGLSSKTVRNRWCDMRSRYKWNSTNNTTPVKARGRAATAAKADSSPVTGRVTKKRAPVTRKTVTKKSAKGLTPAASDEDSESDIKPIVKTKLKTKPEADVEIEPEGDNRKGSDDIKDEE